MKLKTVIPAPQAVMREGLVVLGGVLIAAYILSRFPGLKSFVASNSVTVRDPAGNILYSQS